MRGSEETPLADSFSCLEMMGEERSVCVEQSPVLSHRASLGGSSGGGLGGLGGGGVMSISRMRPSHSSQDVASISHEQDYWEYGPGIVDRLKSKFINLSMNNQVGSQNGIVSSHSAGKKNHLRSCASLENLQDGSGVSTGGVVGASFHKATTPSSVGGVGTTMNATHKLLMTSPANMRHHEARRNPLVPKSPSMEILLDANRHYDNHNPNSNSNNNKNCNNAPGTQRAGVVSSSISSVVESELPRRDIVRKYKTFFEQTSTSSSPQHLSNGSIYQTSPPSHLSQKQGSGGILRNNKTSPVKKPVANIKPLRKEQPPPEPEMRDSPPLNKFADNKDNDLSSSPTAFVSTTANVRGTEATLNEINLQVNASGGHSFQSHNDLSVGSINASTDIMSISCEGENRPQSSSTPVTSRQMASSGPQHQLMSSAGFVGAVPEPRTPSLIVKPRACPLLLSESNSRPLAGCMPAASASLGNMGSYAIGSLSSTSCNSMVFDFRGKDVKPQVAVMPSPVKPPSREELDGLDDSSEPSGITFIGENVVIGGGSLISTRNKKLSIHFNEQNLSSFFEYEAEDDDEETDEDPIEDFGGGEREASGNTTRGLPSAVLGNYKPGALSSDDEEFQLGMNRLRRQEENPAQESINQEETDEGEPQAKPASHEETSVYSQVGSSDLLF